MTQYQRECAGRAVKCMKGHNRTGALAWIGRCRDVGLMRQRHLERRDDAREYSGETA